MKELEFDDALSVNQFQKYLQHLFPSLVYFLKAQLKSLCLSHQSIPLPHFKPFSLLDRNMLLLFGLTNNQILNQPSLELLYNSNLHGKGFQIMVEKLTDFDSPVIILIKNVFHTVEKDNQEGIFGAFTDCKWVNSTSYFGNQNCYLFQYSPSFRTFFPSYGKGGTEFVYMNTNFANNQNIKVGIGFGGFQFDKFRIWLD